MKIEFEPEIERVAEILKEIEPRVLEMLDPIMTDDNPAIGMNVLCNLASTLTAIAMAMSEDLTGKDPTPISATISKLAKDKLDIHNKFMNETAH